MIAIDLSYCQLIFFLIFNCLFQNQEEQVALSKARKPAVVKKLAARRNYAKVAAMVEDQFLSGKLLGEFSIAFVKCIIVYTSLVYFVVISLQQHGCLQLDMSWLIVYNFMSSIGKIPNFSVWLSY